VFYNEISYFFLQTSVILFWIYNNVKVNKVIYIIDGMVVEGQGSNGLDFIRDVKS
jgi:hypothetical protein